MKFYQPDLEFKSSIPLDGVPIAHSDKRIEGWLTKRRVKYIPADMQNETCMK